MIDQPAVAVVVLAITTLMLAKGAEWVVVSASHIARHFRLSELTIGLTVVALGTSVPEFVVTVLAAFGGQPDISIGNVVGSNIFNTGLVLGLAACVWVVPISRTLARRDVPILLVGSGLVLFFLRDQDLSRLEGLAMFAALVTYLIWVIRGRGTLAAPLDGISQDRARPRDAFLLLLGLASVGVGAQFLVKAAVSLAQTLGWSDWTIGATIVAGGTSLPEFATSIMAARRGHTGLILGNLVGSDIFNLLGVLGLAAFIHPLAVDRAAVVGLWMMLGAVGLLLALVFRKQRVPRLAGALLVSVALARWAFDILRTQ
jgi:cation:H+ antiporter